MCNEMQITGACISNDAELGCIVCLILTTTLLVAARRSIFGWPQAFSVVSNYRIHQRIGYLVRVHFCDWKRMRPGNNSLFLFALQNFCWVTLSSPQGLGSDHDERYRQNGEQPTTQLHNTNGVVEREIDEHDIFKEKISYGKGN